MRSPGKGKPLAAILAGFLLIFGIALAHSTPCAAAGDPMNFGKPGPKSHLFGSWGGVRKSLKKHGVKLGLSYIGQLASNVSGGKRQGTTYAQQIELKTILDWGKIAGLSGLTTHIVFINRAGQNTSPTFINDKLFPTQQIVVTAGGGVVAHLVYAYFQQTDAASGLKIKFGRLPVMNDFGVLKPGCDFMALTVCATRGLDANVGWTVFPRATWGADVFATVSSHVTIGTGLYEVNRYTGGRSGFDWLKGTSGVMLPFEVDFSTRLGIQPGLYKLGVYLDTAQIPDWDTAINGAPLYATSAPAARTQRYGFYALAQQALSKRMTVLAGYVFNGARTSLFEHFGFLALLDQGPIPGRPKDRLGLSWAYGRVSHDLTQVQRGELALGLPLKNQAPGVQTDEMLAELNYNIALYRGVYLMPDLQYVMRPDGTNVYPNAFVVGVQVRIKF